MIHTSNPRAPGAGREAGFTMIEILVAIIIVSFGLLGVAGLLITGLQFTTSAQQRATATLLAYDMVDRIRANLDQTNMIEVGTGADNYNKPSSNPAGSGSPYLVPKPACVGETAAPSGVCSISDMASQDLYEWQIMVGQRLGSGVGIVCRDSSNLPGRYDGSTVTHQCDGLGPRFAIKIYWLDDRSSVANSGKFSVFQSTFIP